MLSFMQGSCQRLAMAKIDIGGQVHMVAHGCKWPCSFYNREKLQYYINSNMFLEFFISYGFCGVIYGNFGRAAYGTIIIIIIIIIKKTKKTNPTPKNEKFGKFAETRSNFFWARFSEFPELFVFLGRICFFLLLLLLLLFRTPRDQHFHKSLRKNIFEFD